MGVGVSSCMRAGPHPEKRAPALLHPVNPPPETLRLLNAPAPGNAWAMEAMEPPFTTSNSPGRRKTKCRADKGVFMKIKKTGVKGGKVVWGT